MAKKMSKASVKISNNYNHNHHHHRRRRHHNTLKPRVYITQSSSFKTLVQELTAYDHNTANPSILPAIPPSPPEAGNGGLQINHNHQHTDNKDHDYNTNDNISSFDDLDSSWLTPFGYTDHFSDELLGSQQQQQQQQQPPSFVPKTGNQISLMESWLLEIGPSAYMH